MDFPSLSPRAKVNPWQVNISLTAYAGVLLGLLVDLMREGNQIIKSNHKREVSRWILVSRLLSCSAGFYGLPCESVKLFLQGVRIVHACPGCRLMRLRSRWSIAGMVWRFPPIIFRAIMREIQESEKK